MPNLTQLRMDAVNTVADADALLDGVTELKNQLNEKDEVIRKLSLQLKVKIPERNQLKITPTNLRQRIRSATDATDLSWYSDF